MIGRIRGWWQRRQARAAAARTTAVRVFFLDRASGEFTVSDISRLVMLPEREVLEALRVLVNEGVLSARWVKRFDAMPGVILYSRRGVDVRSMTISASGNFGL